MKKFLSIFLCLGAFAISEAAGRAPKPPKGVFTVDTYAEAKSKAASEDKLLVYMWSELESSCPKCSAGTDAAIKAYKSNKGTILVFGEGKDTSHAPASLRGALGEATKKGNAIPIVIIVDPKTEKMLASASYAQFAEDDRVFKKLLKEAEEAKEEGDGDKDP
jgi:hypothetical protein